MNIWPGSPSPAIRSDTGSAVVPVLELRPALEEEDEEVTGVSAKQNTVSVSRHQLGALSGNTIVSLLTT